MLSGVFMKITHVISDSNVGGAGILLASVTRGLMDSFDFEIILPRGSELIPRLPSGRVKITELDIKRDKSFDPRDTMLLYRYFKMTRPDAVHTHASLSARLGAVMAGVRPAISTRHCAKPSSLIRKRGLFSRLLYDLSTDLTLSTADFATDNLIAEGVPKERIVTIKNGSAKMEKLSEREAEDLRKSLGIPIGARIVGSVARLETVKGQDVILRAAAKLQDLLPDVFYLFVGDGSQRERYESLAARLGLGKRAIFIGYVEEPWRYESLFSVYVNASRGTETSCLATSECMGMGIPAVVSDFGGNTEMVEDGENGLIFSCDNAESLSAALFRILSDEALLRRLSLGAERIYSEKFSLGAMLEGYKGLYCSLSRGRRLKKCEKD